MGLRRSFKPTNILQNGDFSKGTTGWTALHATVSALNNIMEVFGRGSANIPRIWQIGPSYVVGKKIYYRAKMKVTNELCAELQFYTYNGVSVSSLRQSNPVINTEYNMSQIVTHPEVGTQALAYYCAHSYASALIATDKIMKVREVMAIVLNDYLPADILALSDANLKAWCDLNIPVWFDGTLGGGVIGSIGGLK